MSKTFGCCRFIYNWALSKKSEQYKKDKSCISIFSLDKTVNDELKKSEETAWLKEVNSQSLQASLRHLDAAYTKFFRDKKGFPKFKNKYDKQSFANPQNTEMNFDGNLIYLPKFKKPIKCIFDRKFEGKIKTSTVCKSKSGKYFISILVEENIKDIISETPVFEKTLGIDLGIKTYATFSDGNKIENPKHLIKRLKQLKRACRRHSKKKKDSKNREKSRVKLAKIYEKVTNCRNDFLHKLTTGIVKNQNYTSIAIEDLSVTNMMKNRRLSRQIQDAAWGTFRSFLEYKCKWYGKNLLVIGRFDPSSKLCSCGNLNQELTLKDRTWTCSSCGTTHDRDVLAANNIKHFAFCKQDSSKEKISVARVSRKPFRRNSNKTLGDFRVSGKKNQEVVALNANST